MTTPIGVQMYTVDALAEEDFPGVLKKISDMGYQGIELYGMHGLKPAEVKLIADDLGLELFSAHVPFPAGEDARRLLDEQKEMGVPVVVWSLEPEEFDTEEDIVQGSERVNEGAANAKDYGIEVGYHNHWAEFVNSFGGRRAYEILWECLSPDVVAELDVYWAQLGRADPVEVVTSLGPRARFLHVKDGPAEDPLESMVAVGKGSLDIPAILGANPAVRWHIVEFDRCATDIFQALRESYQYLVGSGLSAGRIPVA